MSVHRLTNTAREANARRAYARSAFNAALMFGIALVLMWRLKTQWYPLLLIGPILLFGIYRAVRKADEISCGYQVELGPDSVIVRRRGMREEHMRYDEIAFAAEVPRKGLLIRTADGKNQIGISAGVDSYASVVDRIRAYVDINPARLSS